VNDCLELDAFFARHERRAFFKAQMATQGNHADSLDIVQDAMMNFVRKNYVCKPRTEWAPLFHRILQNRIMDWHRRQKIRNGILRLFGTDTDTQEDEVYQIEDRGQATDRSVQLDMAGEALQQALKLLPIRQQQTFLLRAWEGLDTGETARAMGISEGSVKTHYSRALNTLREKLGEHWP